jgi:hypothetical protein
VHLLFTPHRSSKARLLRNLPKFPILIDYLLARWNKKEVSLALAALEHHGRVRGISLGTRLSEEPTEVFEAMNRHLPELESLEIGSGDIFGFGHIVILPDTFLLGSASSLRRLKLQDAELRNLSSQLSTLTSLVDLSLTIEVPLRTVREESFIQSLVANLQRMSCLRRLELRLTYPLWYHIDFVDDSPPRLPPPTGDIVPLPNLTELVLSGDHIYLEALVADLAAPSLHLLNAEFTDPTNKGHIPHFCRLISDTVPQFRLVRLDFSKYKVQFTAETHSKSVHPQHFKISIPGPISSISNILSGSLATVEELVIRWNISGDRRRIVQWCGFMNDIPQVKFLQVPWQLAHDVAHSFQQDDQEPAMDLLPALEQIKMDMTRYYPPPHELISQNHGAIPDAFNPLIDVRKKMGRPITLSFTDLNWMVNAP